MTSIPPVVVRYQVDGVDAVVAGNARVAKSVSTSAALARNMGAAMATANRQAQASAEGNAKWAAGLTEMQRQSVGFTGRLRAMASAMLDADKRALGFSSISGTLLSNLRALAAGFGALRLAQFIGDSVAAAAAIGDLAQKTGATAETLSVLGFVGKRNGVAADALGVSFRQLANTLGSLRDGNDKTVATFAKLGLAAKDLQGLTVDQTFLKVAKALAGLPDGMEKAEIATDLFGRAGTELIPLLNELADKGFPRLAEEARRAGAVISEDAAKAADEFKDSLDNLKSAAMGAARTIASPFLPLLTDAAKALQELFSRKAGDTLRHDLEDIAKAIDLITLKTFDLRKKLDDATGQTLSDFVSRPVLGTHPRSIRPATETATPLELDDEIKALAAIREAGRLTEEQQRRINEIVKQLTAEYDAAGTSLTRQAEILGQLDSLTRTRKEAAQGLTEEERRQEEILRRQAQEAGKLLQLEQERRQAVEDRIEAERRAEFARAARSTGGAESFEALIARQQQRFAAQFDVGTPTVSDEVQRNLAEQRAATLEYIRTLQEEADATALAYQNIGESIRGAVASGLVDFTDSLARLGEVVSVTVEPEVDEFGHVLKDQFGNTIEKVTRDVFTLGDAFVGLARTVVDAIQRVVAELLAAKIVESLAGTLFGGGIPKAPGLGGQSLGLLAGAAPSFFAEGGYVSGPGTSTSDSIPAQLSAGEYVINARATAANLDILEAINGGLRPVGPIVRAPRHFAGGGLVEGGGMSTVVLEAPEGWNGRVQNDSDTLQVIVRHKRDIRDMLR